MTDRWFGNFLDKFHSSGLAENTLLIVLSDHGVALGEHNATGKPFWALYPELTDITYLIRHPEGKGAGKTSDFYASTHDVAPTILGALGIDPPQPRQGQDLSVLLEGGEPEPRLHFTLGYSNFTWARDESHAMFVRNDGADARLYDLRTDPGMNRNVARNYPGVVKRMMDGYLLKDAGGPLPLY